ncbi:MAG: murein biosynthesis integral membrane protein MurJ [Planctomycetes bacterium]|nr:murein biosynthesis integral membrane protein MurJ [Planctomycetota bacterium]
MEKSEKRPSATTGGAAGEIAGHAMGVSLAIMVSRVLGLLRDVVLVFFFSAAAWITDAFYFAFTVPNLFRNLLGEGALTAAFLPEFVRRRENGGTGGRLASTVISVLLALTGTVTIAGAAGCAFAATLAEAGEKAHLTLVLLATMLPFAALVCCAAIMGAVLQSLKVFILPAAMSCLLNLFIIVAVALPAFGGVPENLGDWRAWVAAFAVRLPEAAMVPVIRHVAVAVLAAGVAQLLIQYPVIRARGVRLSPAWGVREEGFRKVVANFLPAAAGLGVVQLNTLLDNLIGYGLSIGWFGTAATGATTYLFLGNRLMQLPLGVFTIAVATTAFPTFAALAARDEKRELVRTVFASLRGLWFVMLPAALGLMVAAWPLVALLYQDPDMRFSDAAVLRTVAVLVCLAPALPFFSAIHLFTRVFYAMGDYRTPVRIAVQTLGLNVAGNLLLMHLPAVYLRMFATAVPGLPSDRLGEAGLALSTTLCAAVNAARLWRALGARVPDGWAEETRAFLGGAVSMFVSAAITALLAYWVMRSIPYGPELPYRLERAAGTIIGGMLVYSVVASTFCPEDYDRFMARFRRRKKP